MFSISKCAIRIPTRLGLTCLLLGLLACAGGNSNNDIPPIGTTPPSPPSLSAPVNGTVGFPVTASVLGPSSTLVYNWTLSPLTASFKGGGTSTSGTSVTFTSNTIGNVILSCVATAGNVLSSLPATAPVAINAPSNAAGTFVPAGNLLTARWGLAAVNLSSSTILVTGGSSNGTLAGALNSTEIYTVGQVPVPSVPGPNMNTARYYHALVALPSTGGTQFLVTGGGTTTRTLANPNPNTEIYDSGLNAFSVPASAMANDRTYHTATAIVTPTSSVFIAGGLTNAGVQVNTEELYTVNSQLFASAGTTALAPYHTATSLPDGTILLVSHTGSGSSWQPFATIYNPATGTFIPPNNQPAVAREGHQALLLSSPASVLILGGSNGSGPVASAEYYNPVTKLFSPVGAAMASPREDFGVGILGTKVLLVGGSADGISPLATAEIFDPAGPSFTPTSSMGTPRIGPTVLQLPAGRVVVLGGVNSGGITAVETFPN